VAAPVAAGLLSPAPALAAGFAAVWALGLALGVDFTRVSVVTAVPAAGFADWAVVPEPLAAPAFWFAEVF
jgi:hypothetical protein